MSAGANRWALEPAGAEPAAVPPREPIDLDKLQEVAWALVGAVLYLLGVVAAAAGFGAWLGLWAAGVVLLVAGGVPSGYSLAKAHQRSAAREAAARQAKFRGDPPPGGRAFGDIPTRP